MPITEFLYDDTIALAPLEDEHVPALQRWINSQNVVHFLRMDRPMSEAAEREWLAQMRSSSSDVLAGIVLRSEQRLIGSIGLHGLGNNSRNAEYGLAIGEPGDRGKGYGTAAGRLLLDHGFNRLNLNSIYLTVHGHNTRGMASYAKLGFQPAGVLRQHVWREGRYVDLHYMDLLREDFNALHAAWRKAQHERYGIGS